MRITSSSLDPWRNVARNVALWLRFAGMKRAEIDQHVAAALIAVPITVGQKTIDAPLNANIW
jgi:ABC-type nitrate/sulfonate/bicarbonate transport system ATPase subunit